MLKARSSLPKATIVSSSIVLTSRSRVTSPVKVIAWAAMNNSRRAASGSPGHLLIEH